jgi:hypothetical protein
MIGPPLPATTTIPIIQFASQCNAPRRSPCITEYLQPPTADIIGWMSTHERRSEFSPMVGIRDAGKRPARFPATQNGFRACKQRESIEAIFSTQATAR